MSLAEQYRQKAAAMAAKARRETDREIQASYWNLERSYSRLALQVEKYVDSVRETPASQPAADHDAR